MFRTTLVCFILALVGGSVKVNAVPLGQRTVTVTIDRPLKHASVPRLVKLLSAADGWKRVESSAELLDRGPSVLAALEKVGAKPIASLNVPRLDVIYSLIKGLTLSRSP